MKTESNNQKRKAGRFAKGISGNPAGRPIGSRNKATIDMEQLLEGQAQKLTAKAIEQALNGNMSALRLCMERLLPPCNDRPIHLELQPVENMAQLSSAVSSVMKAIGEGSITPNEGEVLANILSVQNEVLVTTDIDRRLKKVEQVISEGPPEKSSYGTGDLAQRLLEGRTTQGVDQCPH